MIPSILFISIFGVVVTITSATTTDYNNNHSSNISSGVVPSSSSTGTNRQVQSIEFGGEFSSTTNAFQQREAQQDSRVTQTSSTGNCVAGGSGYGLSFDYNEADVLSLRWNAIPKDRLSIEFWYKNTNPFHDSYAMFSYSAYNVNGYQNSGKGTFESPNEFTFILTPTQFVLWRGDDDWQLMNTVNPFVEQIYTDTEWHHYAVTWDRYANDGQGSVSFYLDSKHLDFGATSVRIGDEVISSYAKAQFSIDWDVPESADAINYYGTIDAEVIYAEQPCYSETYSLPSNGNTAVVIKRSSECTLYEQAVIAAEKGAKFVIFQSLSQRNVELAEHPEGKLEIPVIAVDFETGNKMVDYGTVTFHRSRDAYPAEGGIRFGEAIEEGGVLIFGQESDTAWGYFDKYQALDGILDEVRIWDVVRTPEQIKANYRKYIDVENDPEATHLNLYYTFDDENPSSTTSMTKDHSPSGRNNGLLGSLPTIENQLTYADGEGNRSPTRPDSIPTSSSPLVGMGDVVVAVAPGEDTIIELKSFDPDGDDLITKIVSYPLMGSLYSWEDNFPLALGDIVVDTSRTESKRVIFRAPSDFTSPIKFQYSIEDGGEPVTATVRLVPHVIENAPSFTATVKEDQLEFFSLAKPSLFSQDNMQVVITSPPEHGTLFQAQFDPSSTIPTFVSLSDRVDEFGRMDRITDAGDAVSNSRGVVFYIPENNAFSFPAGSVYDTVEYKFVDQLTGLESGTGILSIVVEATNDSPVFDPVSTDKPIVKTTDNFVLELRSTDVDADTVENFAERSFARITKFPTAGVLHQYDESEEDKKGNYMDGAVLGVPQVFEYASRVVRYSSSFSSCSPACYSWNNPDCEDCKVTGWSSFELLGPPNTFPEYVGSKRTMSFSHADTGHEFVELEFPFEMYINGVEVYETYKPGSIFKISTTDNYTDNTAINCAGAGTPESDEIPVCLEDTEWDVLWSKPQELVTPGPEEAVIFRAPVCSSTKKTRIIRIDFDTSVNLGWEAIDSVKLIGTLIFPPGLVADSKNQVVYVPRDGVHGNDEFSFVFSDCVNEGEDATISLSVEAPAMGDFSSSFFYEGAIEVFGEPNQIFSKVIDLTDVINSINQVTDTEIDKLIVEVFHTDALGVTPGKQLSDVSISQPYVNVDLGLQNSGAPFSHLELWLTDISSTLTFRIKYKVLLCLSGAVSNDLLGLEGFCIVEDDRLLSPGVLTFGYVGIAISWILAVSFLTWIFVHRKDNVVKCSQMEFLCLICIGAIVSSSTLIALSWQAGSDDDNTVASVGCTAAPFLYAIGWVLMYSSLSAKTFRLYKIMKNNKEGKHETISFISMFQIVIFCLCIDLAIVIAWTIKNPLVYEREEISRNVDLDNGVVIIQSVGQCKVRDENGPDLPTFMGPLLGFHFVLLIATNILLLKVRNMKDEYQESKYIAMAMVLMLEILVVGVPIVIAIKDSAAADYAAMVGIIALHDIGILCFTFIPKILFQKDGPEKRSGLVESMILASFKKLPSSKWDEALQAIHNILEPGSETREVMTRAQAEQLETVVSLLIQGAQGRRDSDIMHIPSDLMSAGIRGKFSSGADNAIRYVIKEFGGVNLKSDNSVKSADTRGSADRESGLLIDTDDKNLYVLPEFADLSQQQKKTLFKLLSWWSLKQWDFNVFDIVEVTGGNPLLFVGWAILGSPHSQYSMAKACGMEDVTLDEFEGYHFHDSAVKLPIKKLCDYLRVIENDYITENPYHNEIHAADVVQTLHVFIQMKGNSLAPTDLELFSVLLAAVIHDVNHPGKNNAFQINARSHLALVYNDISVLENSHVSYAFMKMIGDGDFEEGGGHDDDLNILYKVTKEVYVSIRTKVIDAVLQTDMTKHFHIVNSIKGLILAHHAGQELSDENRWEILAYMLHLADISNPAKGDPLFKIWTDRCLEEFFAQGDKEETMKLPISPNCDRKTTKKANSQIGFINFVIKPAYEVLGLLIPKVEQRILPVIENNVRYWEGQKLKEE